MYYVTIFPRRDHLTTSDFVFKQASKENTQVFYRRRLFAPRPKRFTVKAPSFLLATGGIPGQAKSRRSSILSGTERRRSWISFSLLPTPIFVSSLHCLLTCQYHFSVTRKVFFYCLKFEVEVTIEVGLCTRLLCVCTRRFVIFQGRMFGGAEINRKPDFPHLI